MGRIKPAASARMRTRRGITEAAGVLALCCSLGGCSQADIHAQAASSTLSVAYIGAWGVKGDGPGQLDEPTCIATDSLGNVYLADAGSRFVDKFSWEGRPLLSFQEPVLKHPQSIAVDSGGAIYVTDSGRSSTFIFFPGGDRYHELRLRTRPNPENNLSVAVGEDGLIHILDANAGHVFTFTPRMRLLRNWQPAASVPNATIKPRAEGIAVGPDGYLYVDDTAGNRILRFTEDGHFETSVDASGAGEDRRLSDEFAVARGYILAMDADGRMLHVWSVDGSSKLDVDLASELGQANRSAPDIAVSPRKELLVLDAPEARVLRYRLNF